MYENQIHKKCFAYIHEALLREVGHVVAGWVGGYGCRLRAAASRRVRPPLAVEVWIGRQGALRPKKIDLYQIDDHIMIANVCVHNWFCIISILRLNVVKVYGPRCKIYSR